MVEASDESMEGAEDLKALVDAAAGIVVGSGKRVGIALAMEYVGFTLEQRRDMTMYQRVRRRSKKLTVVELKSI